MHTKEKIKRESTELFATLGYEGTSMANIAERVGIKKPSLYAHYKNKEALFLDLVMDMSLDYVTFIKDSLGQGNVSIEKQLYQAFITYVHDWTQDNPANQFYSRFLQYPPQQLAEPLKEMLSESERKVRALFSDVMKEGQEQGALTMELDSETMAYTYFALIEGLVTEVVFYSPEEISKQAEKSWSVYWRGIRA
ncbi:MULTISPECIES: TetR/AcrR family transcriptional regulator [Shouchella]|uniref:TetR/AcrR family transcriptional regulator n=2 Tax=Shouchella TaxID=2893057 RepID=A0ABY7WAZ2_9BACI|nr:MULTISPECIES: TetR/AcrR family transcriptional regulator [Shouchella]MED4128147.1 TetR/AcrR family transcriptional regulator [Shouchella miscanthi]WDF04992.1 TetR/AcrR family transcriptional regulator [Shouchella hunanensis]GAF21156.1 transcriptional regulator, TetR family [Bacillus sp. JCM 19047]